MLGTSYFVKRTKKTSSALNTPKYARRLRRPESVSSAGSVLKNADPVYMLMNSFSKQFDAVGKERAMQMSGESPDKQGGPVQGKNEQSRGEKRGLHDYPGYSHSDKELDRGDFYDRFSSYAFRGGRLANAVMAGQGKQMFTICLSRALGRSFQGEERQKTLLGESSVGMQVENSSAQVRFNHDARTAVGIVTDSIRGSTRLLELFKKLASDSGEKTETPLEFRNIGTLREAMPFLDVSREKEMIASCRERLKELERDNSAEGASTARLLKSALVKQTAVLQRKEAEQRRFLTKLNEIHSNVREAEKLFSSDGFAEQALQEAERLSEDIPPDDGRRRGAAAETVSAVADFIAGLRGEADGTADRFHAEQGSGEGEKTGSGYSPDPQKGTDSRG